MDVDLILSDFKAPLALDWGVLLLRLLGAAVLTGAIGFERETRGRSAGLRTHMLVGVAAATYCFITLELIAMDYGQDVRMDPIRLIEAVTGGVAFLAAGMIFFAKGEVHGLTTGASMWLAAAVGLAVGLGLWPTAVMATLLALFIMRILGRMEVAGRKEEK